MGPVAQRSDRAEGPFQAETVYTRIFGFRNEPLPGSFMVLMVNDSLTLVLA